MVIKRQRETGMVTTELIVAMAIITIAMFPMAFSFVQEQRLLRASYHRAVAMELIDGEMEILLAGEWHSFAEGSQPYFLHADSATNLPPGKATLTISGKHMRLVWRPENKSSGGEVLREAEVK